MAATCPPPLLPCRIFNGVENADAGNGREEEAQRQWKTYGWRAGPTAYNRGGGGGGGWLHRPGSRSGDECSLDVSGTATASLVNRLSADGECRRGVPGGVGRGLATREDKRRDCKGEGGARDAQQDLQHPNESGRRGGQQGKERGTV